MRLMDRQLRSEERLRALERKASRSEGRRGLVSVRSGQEWDWRAAGVVGERVGDAVKQAAVLEATVVVWAESSWAIRASLVSDWLPREGLR